MVASEFYNPSWAVQELVILIDNYGDLSILERLTKKQPHVNVIIYTDPKNKNHNPRYTEVQQPIPKSFT